MKIAENHEKLKFKVFNKILAPELKKDKKRRPEFSSGPSI
jgi:hypothetical protein